MEIIQEACAIKQTFCLKDLVPDSFFVLFWKDPMRVTFYLFTLVMWMAKELVDLMGLSDATLYVTITLVNVWYPWLVLRTQKGKRGTTSSPPAIRILSFAIIIANYTVTIHYRAKFVPSLLVAFSPVFSLIRQKV